MENKETIEKLTEQVNKNNATLSEIIREVKQPSLFDRIKNALKNKPTRREVIIGGQKYNINF